MNKQQIILVGLFMSIFILGVILLRDVLSFSRLEAYRNELSYVFIPIDIS